MALPEADGVPGPSNQQGSQPKPRQIMDNGGGTPLNLVTFTLEQLQTIIADIVKRTVLDSMNQALDRREQTQRSQGFQIPPAPTRLPEPQGPVGGEGPQGPPDLSNISIAWETEDVGYFNPEATAQEITKQGGTVYNDVYTFTDRVKYIVTIKGDKVVRLNLIACLRGTAIAWHTTELTDSEKRSLHTLPVQEG